MLKRFMEHILMAALTWTEHCHRMTVAVQDIQRALRDIPPQTLPRGFATLCPDALALSSPWHWDGMRTAVCKEWRDKDSGVLIIDLQCVEQVFAQCVPPAEHLFGLALLPTPSCAQLPTTSPIEISSDNDDLQPNPKVPRRAQSSVNSRPTALPVPSSSSRSAIAGLQFRVWRAEKTIRVRQLPCAEGAPVYLAAVMEYLTTEILKLAGNSARDKGHRNIQFSDVLGACKNDKNLNVIVFGTEFREGLFPRELLPRVGAMLPGMLLHPEPAAATIPEEPFSSDDDDDQEEEEEEPDVNSHDDDDDNDDPERRQQEAEGHYRDSDYDGL